MVAVAGVCAGLAVSGSATAMAAPGTGDGTQANLLYSVNGGAWSDSVTAQRGDTVTARLFYDTTKDTTVSGASLTTQVPDGFTYVPGSTRNVLAPGSNVAAGVVGAETKAAAVADSVWSGDQLQVSPSAGFNGESNASQSGVLRNGVKRYLNLHNCDYRNGSTTLQIVQVVDVPGASFSGGTNVSNTADSALDCGPGQGPWVQHDAGSAVGAFDLLGNRYFNLHGCVFRYLTTSSLTTQTVPTTGAMTSGSNTSNVADSTAGCASSQGAWTVHGNSAVGALDLVGNRYVNLHSCVYQSGNSNNYGTMTVPSTVANNQNSGTNTSNIADVSVQCGPGGSGWSAANSGYSAVQALDLLDTARGQGFIEFAFTSEVPAAPACEVTVTEPAVVSTRQGVLNGSGTGAPSSSAGITLAEFTATGEECPEELAANTDEYTTVQGTGLSGNVLDNDVVPAGSTVTVTGPDAGPWRGDLVLNADGTFTYTPAPGWVGTDSFSYTITDQDGNTAVGTVNITITEDENGIPLLAPGAAAAAGLLGLGGLGLYRRKERQTV